MILQEQKVFVLGAEEREALAWAMNHMSGSRAALEDLDMMVHGSVRFSGSKGEE